MTEVVKPRERGILFQGPMVRALLADIKTQTRRAIRVQPGPSCCIEEGMAGESPFVYSQLHGDGPGHVVHEQRSACPCPYGQPGDLLYVREAFSGPDWLTGIPPGAWLSDTPIWYWVDGNPVHGDWTRPKPGIHLPRWASRILMEVTDVRVERLQDISEADAIAEGCHPAQHLRGDDDVAVYNAMQHLQRHSNQIRIDYPIARYMVLWETINGDGTWAANPWVWKIEFKRIAT